MPLPGAPSVYYGDEVGMEGGNDPDCRRAFPAGAEGRDEVLRAFHRDAIAARRAHPALRADRVRVAGARGAAVALVRGGPDDPSAAGETLLVAVNAGMEPAALPIAVAELAGRTLVPVAATSEEGDAAGAGPDRSGEVEVGPDGAGILRLGPRAGVVLGPGPADLARRAEGSRPSRWRTSPAALRGLIRRVGGPRPPG
jgi:hypothetical protein